MKTIQVSEATGPTLDILVALALGAQIVGIPQAQSWILRWPSPLFGDQPKWSVGAPAYSTDPAQAWPIIEREKICIKHGKYLPTSAYIHKGDGFAAFDQGPTALIAAMRCFVISRLGPTVEVPEELT